MYRKLVHEPKHVQIFGMVSIPALLDTCMYWVSVLLYVQNLYNYRKHQFTNLLKHTHICFKHPAIS